MAEEKPIIEAQVDTRSGGPLFCEGCDSDLESVLLTRSLEAICPECGQTLGDGDDFDPEEIRLSDFTSIKCLSDDDVAKFEKKWESEEDDDEDEDEDEDEEE